MRANVFSIVFSVVAGADEGSLPRDAEFSREMAVEASLGSAPDV